MADAMNIMLISDDHGRKVFEEAFQDAEKKYGSISMVLHAGDTEGLDNAYYEGIAGVEAVIVRGNNDFGPGADEKILNIGGKRIFLNHGHRYGVYMGVQNIAYAGLERQADIVVYGHTHAVNHQKARDIEIINPGSLAGIRSRIRTYGMLMIDDGSTSVAFESF